MEFLFDDKNFWPHVDAEKNSAREIDRNPRVNHIIEFGREMNIFQNIQLQFI